jgi:Zn-dependent protease
LFGENFFQMALIRVPILVFSLSVHEFFHAYMAYRFGDSTAKDMGRLTLNPLAHLDLMGTLVMVITQFRFGWAKPVPVNPFNLRNRRIGDIWVSVFGPISNLGLATIFGMFYRLVAASGMDVSPLAMEFLRFGVIINVILAVFNLLPVFPLDGSHILKNLLPERLEPRLEMFERFGPIILIVLMITGILWKFMWPPVAVINQLILGQ